MIRSAPRIETERLILRAWTKADFRPWHRIVQHPDVHRHFGPDPMGLEEVWRRLAAAVGGWQLLGFGTWAVERKADGKLVGNAGLFNAWRGLDPEFGEACRAVLDWAKANLSPTPFWAIIAPANAPSLKLAEKLGFEVLHEADYHGEPTLVLRRPSWA